MIQQDLKDFSASVLFEQQADGVSFDEEARRAVFESRKSALAFWRLFGDWYIYHRQGGFDVPLAPAETVIRMPRPRLVSVVEWDEGELRRIAFFCPSRELARALTAGMGKLVDREDGAGGLLFELQVDVAYEFEDVLFYLCRLAGPEGVFLEW